MARALRPVYTAPTEQAAKERLDEFNETWSGGPGTRRSPGCGRTLDRVRAVPGLRRRDPPGHLLDQRDRSLHARMRRATRAQGHFPNEQAALKCLYMVVRSLDPTGRARRRWMNRWKPALNAFAITFEGRLFAAGHDMNAGPVTPFSGQFRCGRSVSWNPAPPSAANEPECHPSAPQDRPQ
jgi:putative transposase